MSENDNVFDLVLNIEIVIVSADSVTELILAVVVHGFNMTKCE